MNYVSMTIAKRTPNINQAYAKSVAPICVQNVSGVLSHPKTFGLSVKGYARTVKEGVRNENDHAR
jgi:hypothetical protein